MSTETLCELTIDEYDRMIAAGAFAPDVRLELLDGELVPMSPTGPVHEDIVDLLVEWSFQHVANEPIRIRVQQSIGLAHSHSAPEPDVAWVRKARYRLRRPQSEAVLLVIETAHSSLSKDRDVKRPLYARAGVPEYWIANVEESTVEVHRNPRGGEFLDVTVAEVGDVIAPLVLPTAKLSLAWLFGVEGSDD